MSTHTNKPVALIGEKAEQFILQGLTSLGFEVLLLPADKRLSTPVSSHADMLIFELNGNIFCNKAYYEHNVPIFKRIKKYGYKINITDFNVSADYPNDISLNQAVIGKNIIGRYDSCAEAILKYAEECGYNYCSTKQGYAKCSTLILGEKAIISADAGIISLAENLGINTLKIENGINEIALSGYNYGFIGGASAVYDQKVFFFGDISKHSQGKKISEFCEINGFSVISLGKKTLSDAGGAIILPYLNKK